MVFCDRRLLCVAVIVCVLRPGHVVAIARRFAGGDAAQARPIAAGRQDAAGPDRPLLERFMVMDQGCALLGPDGEEKERLETTTNGPGRISPDGRWAAFTRSKPDPPPPDKVRGQLIIQSRVRPEDRRTVPLVGSSFQLLWSSDSTRVLICERGYQGSRPLGSTHTVYDLGSQTSTRLKLAGEYWPSDWSADGKRVLTSLVREDGSVRVAWINVDGTGEPKFLTSDREVARGAKLSPENRRILCMVGPDAPEDQEHRMRLHVIDLATKKRTIIDKPGHTYGYCWSSDGLKVAYTWQLPLREPYEAVERKTYLITCDPDGGSRKIITTRRYKVPPDATNRAGVIIYFAVLSWWR
jgi:Tol biopolymer transport system component